MIICFFVMAGTFVGPAQGKGSKSTQTKPDFSGNWLLDSKKSSPGKSDKPDNPIRISHREPEFRITRTSESDGKTVERESVYFTDGRGETNPATALLTTNPRDVKPGDVAKELTKSKTKWSGNRLVTRSSLRLLVAGHVIEYELIDEWRLSADGKVLTQTSRVVFQQSDTVFLPAMVPETKRAYNRI
jgi:hypothetical protein